MLIYSSNLLQKGFLEATPDDLQCGLQTMKEVEKRIYTPTNPFFVSPLLQVFSIIYTLFPLTLKCQRHNGRHVYQAKLIFIYNILIFTKNKNITALEHEICFI